MPVDGGAAWFETGVARIRGGAITENATAPVFGGRRPAGASMKRFLICALLFPVLPARAAAPPGAPGRAPAAVQPSAPAPAASASSGLAVLPAAVTLTGPKARQRFLLEETRDGFSSDRSGQARWRSSNPNVVRVDASGTAWPVSDGTAQVVAVVGGRRASATVRVRGAAEPFAWSFANHVLPVLTKAGCNSGACHGAAAGKGGLKLTLRGYDPEADYNTLTRQALGRRIVPADPAASLFLQKPTMRVPHAGGLRFKPGSPEYGILAQWITSGCPSPGGREPKMTGLEVFPAVAVLRAGGEQQLAVRARFDDGHTEDVTRWVKYGTSDAGVAAVDDDGHVSLKGEGEAAITLWYLNKVQFARIVSPFQNPGAAEAVARAERRNWIDDAILKKLAALRIPPSPTCTDEAFIRRVFLDVAGVLPRPDEVRVFLAECAAERAAAGGAARPAWGARERLVDRLLERPEYADYWAYRWSDLLLVSTRRLPARGVWSFYRWIRAGVAENKPWDRFTREILTASGSTLANGAANYWVLHKDPIDLTETTAQAFLGMSLTCCRCHNHPLEKWTLNDYYGMANLFARVRLKNGELPGESLVFAAESGEVPHLRTGVPVPPRPLDGTPLPLEGPEDRREALARWLTSPENPYFTRALVNRVWRGLMGRGLVEAEDDLRLTNPPSNEELLSALAADFAKSGFDVKRLIRTIVTSAAYQRSSDPVPGNERDGKYYATYLPRRLPAEVLLDALSQVTGIPTDFPGYPRGYRALQLPDSEVASPFLTAFGRAPRVQTCACERQEEPTVAQALHLSNGDTLNGKLRASGGAVERLLNERLPDAELLDRLYRLAYGRPPGEKERAKVEAVLKRYPAEGTGRREVVEDLFSALLTSKEFLFNH